MTDIMLRLELFTPCDDERPVFLTGNFNGWAVRDEEYRMTRTGDGRYEYSFRSIPPSIEVLEYKYVKGGWESEELGENGFPPGNRRLPVSGASVRDVAHRWKTHTPGYDPAYYPDIQILSKRFNVPQLRRKRRISVLLPWDYYQSGRRYPVLYLQDGQNLFEDDAPYGTWGVDKQLARLAEKGKGSFILVAIDHGGDERIREFMPYEHQKWGEGLGMDYARFLAETLKPYIDAHFRTLPDREHTGIGGSSMGGLISIYAGLLFPEVYSRFMIFSPSLWAAPRLFLEPVRFSPFAETRIYLYGGAKEGAGVLDNIYRFRDAMESKGYDHNKLKIRVTADPEGRHNEARWGQEFPVAAEWLF